VLSFQPPADVAVVATLRTEKIRQSQERLHQSDAIIVPSKTTLRESSSCVMGRDIGICNCKENRQAGNLCCVKSSQRL